MSAMRGAVIAIVYCTAVFHFDFPGTRMMVSDGVGPSGSSAIAVHLIALRVV